MPNQVWQCVFCGDTFPNTDEGFDSACSHEDECDCNPMLRRCWSCDHHQLDQWGEGMICRVRPEFPALILYHQRGCEKHSEDGEP